MAQKAALVEEIKSLQRGNPDAKEAWWSYCDNFLGGVKDPNRHDEPVLSKFLNMYHGIKGGNCGKGKGSKGGAAPALVPKGGKGAGGWGGDPWGGCGAPSAAPSWGGGGGGFAGGKGGPVGGGGSSGGLADFVKAGQRASVHWKNAWQVYCSLYGNGMNAPSRYDDSHITGFIDYVGQLAHADLQAVAEEQGVALDGQAASKRPAPSQSFMPPAKRPAVGAGFGGGGKGKDFGGGASSAQDDPVKFALVDKIKQLQRSNIEAKEAWWAYCDESYRGVKDPNRHDIPSLEAFLAQFGL